MWIQRYHCIIYCIEQWDKLRLVIMFRTWTRYISCVGSKIKHDLIWYIMVSMLKCIGTLVVIFWEISRNISYWMLKHHTNGMVISSNQGKIFCDNTSGYFGHFFSISRNISGSSEIQKKSVYFFIIPEILKYISGGQSWNISGVFIYMVAI